MTVEAPELAMIPVELFDFDDDNPNEQDLATFNELVDGMRRKGATTAVTGVRREGRVLVIGGEHRVKAARLAGLREYPALLVDPASFEEDERQIEMVRENALHGKLDPMKFTRLWQKLQGKYGPEALQKLMGMGSRDSEMKRLIKDTERSLPDDMRQDFVKRTERIRSVEDLAAVVQALFAQHGSTLPYSYVVFAFGGRTHLLVKATPETFGPIRALAEQVESEGRNLDEVLATMASAQLVPIQE